MKRLDEHDCEYEREMAAARARKHRDTLRREGLRPVQIWVPDDRRAGFAAECRRQCLLVRQEVARRRRWIRLRRGDLVVLETGGRLRALRAPELALVMQSERFDAHSHVAVLPMTRTLRPAPLLRPTIQDRYQAMIDQVRVVPRSKVRMVFGRLSERELLAVDRALAVYLGIGVG